MMMLFKVLIIAIITIIILPIQTKLSEYFNSYLLSLLDRLLLMLCSSLSSSPCNLQRWRPFQGSSGYMLRRVTPLTPPLCLHFVFARRRPTIFVIHNHFIFPAQVQATRLQDAQPGREAVEEHQLSDEPEEVSRPRACQQCGKSGQNVQQGPRPELPLPRIGRDSTFVNLGHPKPSGEDGDGSGERRGDPRLPDEGRSNGDAQSSCNKQH